MFTRALNYLTFIGEKMAPSLREAEASLQAQQAQNTIFAIRPTAQPMQKTVAEPKFTCKAKRMLYNKECVLTVCSPLEVANGSEMFEKKSVQRASDPRDLEIDLSSLFSNRNRVRGDANDNDDVFCSIDGGNRILVMEVALVIVDKTWHDNNVFLRVETWNIAPGVSHSVHVYGDHARILARATEQKTMRASSVLVQPGACCTANMAGNTVDGWCMQCGLRPNTFTLYQSAMADDELARYAEEICTPNGTHDHIQRVRKESLEVNSVSTIARDLASKQTNAAHPELVVSIEQPGLPQHTGVTFVDLQAWCEEVAKARDRFLVNLPLSDLSNAKIKLCARGIGADKLTVVLAAQTMEFVQLK